MERLVNSPLRWPGGKSRVIAKLLPLLKVPHQEYREPFAGGAGVFLSKPKAPMNWLNDADPGVAAFWQTVSNPNSLATLCDMVYSHTPPTVGMWHRWSSASVSSEVELAFRILFLNRTSFSGIIGARPIGGLDQAGPYKVDARWSPKQITDRLRACSILLDGVKITGLDFEEVLFAPGRDVLFFLDPPYLINGEQLYETDFSVQDHLRLKASLEEVPHRWLLTYNDCDEIRDLYSEYHLYPETWFYSLRKNGSRPRGRELMISNFQLSKPEQLSFL